MAPPISLSERAANEWLSSVEGPIKDKLTEMHAAGLITINPEHLPAHLLGDEEATGTNVVDLFKGLFKESKGPMSKVSAAVLDRAVAQLIPKPLQGIDVPQILAPKSFGGNELDDKSLTLWRNFRKDTREAASMSTTLRWVTNFHKKAGCIYTEAALVGNLHLVVPSSQVEYVMDLAHKGFSLQETFDALIFKAGTLLSESELRSEVEKIFNDTSDPIKALDLILELMTKSAGSATGVDAAVLGESRRFVKHIAGEELAAQVEGLFLHQPTRNYQSYHQTLTKNFFQALKKAAAKVHHVQGSSEEPEPRKVSSSDLLQAEMLNALDIE